jgi:hypothetical protein
VAYDSITESARRIHWQQQKPSTRTRHRRLTSCDGSLQNTPAAVHQLPLCAQSPLGDPRGQLGCTQQRFPVEGCYIEGQWQILYDTDTKGERFRRLVPDVKCTTNVNKLPLVAYLRKAPRYVLSKTVQFRTGHALVAAWFQRMNVQTSYDCSCGELESISHILKDCVLREHIRDILRKVSPTLEEKALPRYRGGFEGHG